MLLTLALAATSTAYFMGERRVTLADEGGVRTLSTFAPTVGQALDRLGVEVGPDDLVLPSADAVPDRRIEVRRAQEVVLVLNGERSTRAVTGRTVAEALRDLSVEVEGAFVSPRGDMPVGQGSEIVVAQPVTVRVAADGTELEVTSNSLTAGSLLRRLGVTLGPHDRVEPSIVSYPAGGTSVRVVRVREAIETVERPIRFKTVTRQSDRLELGVREVATAGRDGVRARRYRVVYEDGKVVARTLITNEVIREPRDQVVLLGTRRPVYVPHGGIQTGKATWYAAGGLTAAHRTLPLGTVVRVTNQSNGRSVTVTIRDRGPYGSGRVIDLSKMAFAEISSLSTGVIDVKLEW